MVGLFRGKVFFPKGDYMINWIKNKFKFTILPPSRPKCLKCGLGALYELNIIMHLLDTEDNKTSITSQICESCKDEVIETYNPNWLPPLVR